MTLLSADVTKIPQIGKRNKTLLNKIDIYTVEDLLYHFPFRYEDRSKIRKINTLKIDENVTIQAKLTSIENIYTRAGKRLTKGFAEDSTGEIALIWFNMHYIKRNLKVGKTYYMSGKVTSYGNKLTLVVPDTEEKNTVNIHSGRIVPVHMTTEGITPKWMRTRINDVLKGGAGKLKLTDPLPEKIIQNRGFQDLKKALNQIHFPNDFDTLNEAKRRLAYQELFVEMINAERVKSKWEENKNSYVLEPHQEKVNDFISNLPFSLTSDQKTAIKEISKDMSKDTPMNRLLEGDVGTGKTIVAIIAALIANTNNKNTVYMAPTEILAQQHFETFKEFLDGQEIQIELITGSSGYSSKEGTREKDIKILIGTHALLYKSGKYRDLGLVIIDEQHRFGVEQRLRLLDLTEKNVVPHLLTMTATPIPRTLALTLYGDLDMSVLREHPDKNREIITKVINQDSKQEEVYEKIAKKGLSTFIVCPFIEESYAESMENVKAATIEFERLRDKFFGKGNCALLHGRMSSKEKERAVERFKKGKIQALISTPVIEVGIDIPDADVMIIESAERYGLASLHQLRGRVGRGGKRGFCFVFPTQYSRKSYSMLKSLETTLDGLELAEIDLKMRGKGDIYGIKQHGFMRLKLADINDLEFVKKVRSDVNDISKELESYPDLINHLERIKGVGHLPT